MPVSTKMDSEDHYHSPYDTNDLDSDVSFSPRNFMKYHICVFLFALVFVFSIIIHFYFENAGSL